MHYVITYDIEDDRLRTKTAKVLQRHGCARVQKSVFVAPNLEKKHLALLQNALQRLLNKRIQPTDSLLIIPLRDDLAAEIAIIGHNNVLTELEPKPLKILL
ncbi:MAG: CRISPR-associated endonuclease Cas2 [Saprospiraceae bacterium]|nr:CRISPR-associated endonuclease Cas2 [Saprospiraceae bacterium]